MPAVNHAAHQARVGTFYNKINSDHGSTSSDRQIGRLLGVSNDPANPMPGTHVRPSNEIYRDLSIPISPHGMEEPCNRVVTGGIRAAMQQRPLTTGVLVTTAVLAAVTVVAKLTPDRSEPVAPWLDNVPPHSLGISGMGSYATGTTVLGICEQAIRKCPPTSGTRVNRPSITELQSIKNDAESILRKTQGMVRDSTVEFEELQRAASCAGTRLRGEKVEPMIDAFKAMRSDLEGQDGGLSIDMATRIRAAQMRVEIDQKLPVLTETSNLLYDATVALNDRLMEIAG